MSVVAQAIRRWSVWSLLYPPLCRQCSKALQSGDVTFCAACWVDIPRAVRAPEDRLPKHVDDLHAGFAYRDGNFTREVVHAMKYDGQTMLVSTIAARLLQTVPPGYWWEDEALVPVPLHWIRRGDRGFNQSERLARELSRQAELPPPVPLLKRIRHTPTQAGQGVRRRAENVRGAFSIVKRKECPESVLLIDDVVTTGATVSECARVLKAAGVRRVRVLSFSRAQD